MSRENVELVKRANAAFRRGDWEAVAELMDPDVLLRTDPRWPEQRIYGREAALAFYRGLIETLGSDIGFEEMTDLGDRVLVTGHWATRGHASGISDEGSIAILVTIRDGRVILEEFFLDPGTALKVVGLEE